MARPWLIRVDSRATTGRPAATAAATSGAIGDPTRPHQAQLRPGFASWRAAARCAAEHRPAQAGRSPADRRRLLEPASTRNPASKASPAPVVSTASTAASPRRTSDALAVAGSWPTVAPRAPRLTRTSGASADQPAQVRAVQQRLRLGSGGEEDIGCGVANESLRRAPAAGEERPDGREVEADERARAARELDRPPARQPERLAEQRVGRQVEEIAREATRLQVRRRQPVRGRPVRDERALAAGRDDDPDPARPLAGDAGCADARRRRPRTASTSARPNVSRPTAQTSVDPRPETRQPACRRSPPIRPGAARPAPARRSRSRGRAPGRRRVDDEVAEDDDPRWRRAPAARRRTGRARARRRG